MLGLLYKMTRHFLCLFAFVLITIDSAGEANSDSLIAKSLVERAGNLEELGKFSEALNLIQDAIEFYQKSEMWNELVKSNLNAGVYQFYLGNYDDAIQFFKTAIEVNGEYIMQENEEVAEGINNIGMCYFQKGDYEKALEYLKSALSIRLRIFDESHPDVIGSYINISLAFGNKGDYDNQLFYIQQAHEIAKKFLPAEHTYKATIFNNMSNAYRNLGKLDQRLQWLSKSMDFRLNTLGEMHPKTATAFNNLGVAYKDLGQFDTAMVYLQKAKKVWEEILDKQHPSLATTYHNIGLCYEGLQLRDSANQMLERSLEMRKSIYGEVHPKVAESYTGLASIQLDDRNYTGALRLTQLALISLSPYFSERNISSNPSIEKVNSKMSLFEVLNLKASILLELSSQEKNSTEPLRLSLQTYQLAIDLIDNLRTGYKPAESTQILSANSLSIYEGALEAAFQLYNLEEKEESALRMFQIMEKSKVFLLLLALKDAEAKQFAGIPDSLLQLEKSLKIDLAFHENKLFKAKQRKDTSKAELHQSTFFKKRVER